MTQSYKQIRSRLQLNLKIILKKKAAHSVEQRQTLQENQWGGHPRYSADSTALIDKAITEIHRLSYRKRAKLQNDAIAYFDRMMRNLTKLRSRSFEVPDQICKPQTSTFSSIKYKVQTSLGIPEETYCNTKKYTLHEQY